MLLPGKRGIHTHLPFHQIYNNKPKITNLRRGLKKKRKKKVGSHFMLANITSVTTALSIYQHHFKDQSTLTSLQFNFHLSIFYVNNTVISNNCFWIIYAFKYIKIFFYIEIIKINLKFTSLIFFKWKVETYVKIKIIIIPNNQV